MRARTRCGSASGLASTSAADDDCLIHNQLMRSALPRATRFGLTMLRLTPFFLALAAGCTAVAPLPTPATTGGLPIGQLAIISKGGPAASVRINGTEAVRVPCNGGAALTPGDQGLPALPWNLQVVDQANSHVMLDARVTELPRWLLIERDSAELSTNAIAGPFVACSP